MGSNEEAVLSGVRIGIEDEQCKRLFGRLWAALVGQQQTLVTCPLLSHLPNFLCFRRACNHVTNNSIRLDHQKALRKISPFT